MAAEAEVQAAEREAEVAAAHRGRAEATLLIGAPDPLPSRERSQAVAPTELAKKLLVEYGKRMREAWVQLGEYMDKRLPRRAVARAGSGQRHGSGRRCWSRTSRTKGSNGGYST